MPTCGRNIREHDKRVGDRVRVAQFPSRRQGLLREDPRAIQGALHEGHGAQHLERRADALQFTDFAEEVERLCREGVGCGKVTLLEGDRGHRQEKLCSPPGCHRICGYQGALRPIACLGDLPAVAPVARHGGDEPGGAFGF
jgi:hypothetical protein